MYLLDGYLIDNSTLLLNKRNLYKYDIIIIIIIIIIINIIIIIIINCLTSVTGFVDKVTLLINVSYNLLIDCLAGYTEQTFADLS